MRRALQAALDQLDASRTRALHAERIALEMTQRVREASDARSSALRDGATAREELGMYKVQLANAQSEIDRAQGMLRDQERLRYDAEAAAARARDTARRLKQDRLVQLALEDGRATGYREGLRAGQRIGMMDAQSEEPDDERGRMRAPRDRMARQEDYFDQDEDEDEDEEVIRVRPVFPDRREREPPITRSPQVQPLPASPPQRPSSIPQSLIPGPAGATPAPVRRSMSQASMTPSNILPFPTRDTMPAPARAPHVPVPNVLEQIPEVVNTESSPHGSRAHTIYVEPDDDMPIAGARDADESYAAYRSSGLGGYQGSSARVYVPPPPPGMVFDDEPYEPEQRSPGNNSLERQRIADALRYGNTQAGPQLRRMAAEEVRPSLLSA